MKVPAWLTVLALMSLLLALYLNWSWPWGLLFIYWTIPSLWSGETRLVGPLSRAASPILFWSVVALWLLLGVMMILADAAPALVKIL